MKTRRANGEKVSGRAAVLLSIGLAAVVVAGCGFSLGGAGRADGSREAAELPPYDVRILRDTWGVPHVFGKTDADVAYGLAYAPAEDDYPTIEGALLAARGRLASVYGRKAAPNDYMVALLRLWDAVAERYQRDLSPETRALVEAYAAGVNRYAALHPGVSAPGVGRRGSSRGQ